MTKTTFQFPVPSVSYLQTFQVQNVGTVFTFDYILDPQIKKKLLLVIVGFFFFANFPPTYLSFFSRNYLSTKHIKASYLENINVHNVLFLLVQKMEMASLHGLNSSLLQDYLDPTPESPVACIGCYRGFVLRGLNTRFSLKHSPTYQHEDHLKSLIPTATFFSPCFPLKPPLQSCSKWLHFL